MLTALAAVYGPNGTQTGDYSLNVERTNNPAKPTPIKFGQPVSATFETSEISSYTSRSRPTFHNY